MFGLTSEAFRALNLNTPLVIHRRPAKTDLGDNRREQTMTTGRCLCGATRFSFSGQPSAVLHCHCESCRRATSSPVTTFLTVTRAGLEFEGDAPGIYSSTAGVERFFCRSCGSPMGYANAKYPDDFDVYAATLDDPTFVEPQFHAHHAERLPWIELTDTLPRHPHGSDA